MIGVEFRDEDYQELIEEAHKLVKDMTKIKRGACKIVKALAGMSGEDYDEEEEFEEEEDFREEPSYRGAMYRRGGSGTRMRGTRSSSSGRYSY